MRELAAPWRLKRLLRSSAPPRKTSWLTVPRPRSPDPFAAAMPEPCSATCSPYSRFARQLATFTLPPASELSPSVPAPDSPLTRFAALRTLFVHEQASETSASSRPSGQESARRKDHHA